MNMKMYFGVVLLLLGAWPAVAQVDVVAKYRGTYPTPMTADQKVDLLRHVASDVHGGLLVKRDGTNCGGYSCDIICFSDVTLFDVLQDQDVAAIPRWDATTNPRGYRCELVTTAQLPPLPPHTSPQIPPLSVSSLDLSPILARLQALYDQSERIYADETNQRTAQTATILDAVNSPGWFRSVMGNRYVQMALATVGTYFATHQAMK